MALYINLRLIYTSTPTKALEDLLLDTLKFSLNTALAKEGYNTIKRCITYVKVDYINSSRETITIEDFG